MMDIKIYFGLLQNVLLLYKSRPSACHAQFGVQQQQRNVTFNIGCQIVHSNCLQITERYTIKLLLTFAMTIFTCLKAMI